MSTPLVYVAVVLLAAFAVVGDYFLKLASVEDHAVYNRWFVVGCFVYAVSAFGWVYVMRYIKLSTLGLTFALSTILLLAGLGVLAFGESLNRYELVGIGLGIGSIFLLARFSS